MIYHFPTEFFYENLSLCIKKHPSQWLGNPFKIDLFSVYCNSVESAKASVCNQLLHSECKPMRGCYFIALSLVSMLFSKTGLFMAPFRQKLISSTSLF